MNANGPRISKRVIGCAIGVSNELGAGFLEAVYASALAVELARQEIPFEREKRLQAPAGCPVDPHPNQEIPFEREKRLQVFYKRIEIGTYYADFLVEGCLLVELKALRSLVAEHEAQVMNYLRASGITTALLLNFGTAKLGIKRIVLQHDDSCSI